MATATDGHLLLQELSMIETKIFKDPEGLKLFQEYASDIADPKACKIVLMH